MHALRHISTPLAVPRDRLVCGELSVAVLTETGVLWAARHQDSCPPTMHPLPVAEPLCALAGPGVTRSSYDQLLALAESGALYTFTTSLTGHDTWRAAATRHVRFPAPVAQVLASEDVYYLRDEKGCIHHRPRATTDYDHGWRRLALLPAPATPATPPPFSMVAVSPEGLVAVTATGYAYTDIAMYFRRPAPYHSPGLYPLAIDGAVVALAPAHPTPLLHVRTTAGPAVMRLAHLTNEQFGLYTPVTVTGAIGKRPWTTPQGYIAAGRAYYNNGELPLPADVQPTAIAGRFPWASGIQNDHPMLFAVLQAREGAAVTYHYLQYLLENEDMFTLQSHHQLHTG